MSGKKLRDQNRLILSIRQHVTVSRIGDRKNVRWRFLSLLALVARDNLVGVDGQAVVWVDGHQEEPRVSLLGASATLANELCRELGT